MVRLAFFIPEVLKARLEKMSKKTGLGVSDLIRRAIEDYLVKHGS